MVQVLCAGPLCSTGPLGREAWCTCPPPTPGGVAKFKHFHVQPLGRVGNVGSREAGTCLGQTRGKESKEWGCSPAMAAPTPPPMRFALGVRAPQILEDSYPPCPMWGHELQHPQTGGEMYTCTDTHRHTHTHTTQTDQVGIRWEDILGVRWVTRRQGKRGQREPSRGTGASGPLARTQIHSMGRGDRPD